MDAVVPDIQVKLLFVRIQFDNNCRFWPVWMEFRSTRRFSQMPQMDLPNASNLLIFFRRNLGHPDHHVCFVLLYTPLDIVVILMWIIATPFMTVVVSRGLKQG